MSRPGISKVASRIFRIEIDKGAGLSTHHHEVMFTPGGRSIAFFERVFDTSNRVRFTRMNLKGQIESSGCMEHPDIENYTKHSEAELPVNTTGCVNLWSYAGIRHELDSQRAKPNTWEVLRLCYDTNADRLEVQKHTVEHSILTRLTDRDFL